MTIIQPHKNNHKINFWISIFVVGSLAMVGWAIFLYNQMVNFRHEIRADGEALHKAEIYNAELKDKLYNFTDTNTISSSTNFQSLILDKDPKYIKTSNIKNQI